MGRSSNHQVTWSASRFIPFKIQGENVTAIAVKKFSGQSRPSKIRASVVECGSWRGTGLTPLSPGADVFC
jgi:hypothetical protein